MIFTKYDPTLKYVKFNVIDIFWNLRSFSETFRNILVIYFDISIKRFMIFADLIPCVLFWIITKLENWDQYIERISVNDYL